MPRNLMLLHTADHVAALCGEVATEILPSDVEVIHVVDELLMKAPVSEGEAMPFVHRRVADHIIAAEQAGMDVVMVTSPSISASIDLVQQMVSIPVLRMDQPMADKAVSLGDHVGVIAAVKSTLEAVGELVLARAVLSGGQVTVNPVLCEEAAQSAKAGDRDAYELIVRNAIKDSMARNDVVVLAHASMSRIADTMPSEDQIVPVLSSPRLGFEHARKVIEGLPG